MKNFIRNKDFNKVDNIVKKNQIKFNLINKKQYKI